MKLKEVIQAKDALKALTEKRFTNYQKARELVKIRKTVEAEFDFYAEQEKKAVFAHGEIGKTGTPVFLEDGKLKLKSVEDKQAFDEELLRLLNTEVDGITPITLTEADFHSADDIPTPSEMFALEAFVTFE